jgi:uncharacterized membrane protein
MSIAGQNTPPRPARPFRRAVLRGIATLLPPLLTVVIFIWAWNTIHVYVLDPATSLARESLVWWLSRETRRDLAGPEATADGQAYVRLTDGTYAPQHVVETVRARGTQPPATARELYRHYVDAQFLRPELVIPIFAAVFVLAMYLVGKFLAAGIGRFFWGLLERLILRLPLVRSVYGSVKQVTDFVLSEQQVRFNRIVALEYPRKGIWSLGFVTSEGLSEVADVAGEPILAVLVPTSPMPMTGFTVLVRKSETVELDLSLDEALRFLVSCGVVLPESALPRRGEPARLAATSE